MISVRGVSLVTGDRVRVHHIDLTVAPGEAVSISGDEEGGRAALFAVLATWSRPSAGTVTIGDRDAASDTRHVRSRMAVASADLAAPDTLECVEYMTLTLAARGVARTPRAIGAALDSVGLHRRGRLAALPPSGRVLLSAATAVLMAPDVLLLDDLLGGLTGRAADEMRRSLIEARRRGAAIVHAGQADERDICNRGVRMVDGVIASAWAR